MPALLDSSRTRPLRVALAALAAAALAGLAVAPAGTAHRGHATAARACANADVNPHAASTRTVRVATLCLLNRERRRRHMRGLRHNARLAEAAGVHATDMVQNQYFSHEGLDGSDFVERIVDADYIRRSEPGWIVGENLAWGSNELATPRAIVRAWMESPTHRANVLQRRYREIGIAVVLGAPVPRAQQAATYATEFGTRR
jgi:uncharacterized protein YkwD